MSRRRIPRERGFSLIEILAVAAILALLAALALPNLAGLRGRALRAEALRIAAQLELARQRAIVTGVPHRLWLELDEAEFRLEWLVADPEAAEGPERRFDLDSNGPLPLEAPRAQALRFQPVPGNFGNRKVVTYPFYFDHIQTPQGPIDRGEAWVGFARDGSATYTEIYIEDNAGHRIAVDVFPLDERVRIRDEI